NGGGLKTLSDSPDWNYRVAINPDAKLVAGAGADGIVRLWDVTSGGLRASLMARSYFAARPPSTEWAVLTPAGYFAASPGWSAKARPEASGAALKTRSGAILAALAKPDLALKAMRGEKVDPPVLTPPAAPPAKPADPAAKK